MSLHHEKTSNVTQYDETRALDGTELPNWKEVNADLALRSDEQIQQQQANIARLLRANGIAYSTLSDADESSRPWNLDLAPFVVEPKDWTWLKSALDQRARLKEAIFDRRDNSNNSFCCEPKIRSAVSANSTSQRQLLL